MNYYLVLSKISKSKQIFYKNREYIVNVLLVTNGNEINESNYITHFHAVQATTCITSKS